MIFFPMTFLSDVNRNNSINISEGVWKFDSILRGYFEGSKKIVSKIVLKLMKIFPDDQKVGFCGLEPQTVRSSIVCSPN